MNRLNLYSQFSCMHVMVQNFFWFEFFQTSNLLETIKPQMVDKHWETTIKISETKTYTLRQESRKIFTLNLHDELMLIRFLRFLDFNKRYFKIKGEQIKTVLKMKLNLNMCIRNTKYLSIRITTVYTADFLVPIQWTRNDLHSGESTHKNNNITTRSISLTNKKW